MRKASNTVVIPTHTFTGTQVYLPGEIAETTVTVDHQKIVEIGGAVQGVEIDGRGKILAPALIDVHGDAFERQIMPRPGVFFPTKTALIDTDRQLASNGIATHKNILKVRETYVKGQRVA